MATRIRDTDEQFVSVHFPLAGLDVSKGLAQQPARKLPFGYARTTAHAMNVRGMDAVTSRMRGSSRSGLFKYIPQATVAGWIVQELNILVGSGYDPPGAAMQLSQSGRVVTVVAVNQGDVWVASPGDTTWTQAANLTDPALTPPLNYTGVMQSTALNQKLYFADGVNWVYYDPTDVAVHTWTATAGELPVDADGNAPRLICTWRGRMVLAGLVGDPCNWFMSAVSDPTDWDYSPLSITPTQAIAGSNAPQGLVGDVITTLIPYSDDVLIFGGDHSIYMMRGDPMAGGQIDLVSDGIGMAWGMPWCKDPTGTVYFFSNRTGIYTLIPGQVPQRISQPIDQKLVDVDTGLNTIRMIWNDEAQGLHVFISPTDAPTAGATHYFYEASTGAWWPDQFKNKNHDPLCCVTFDGNDPGDRVPLIGSWDGYVRSIDSDATDDDGFPIESEVIIGPILTQNLDDMLLKDLQAVLSEDAEAVTFNVYAARTAEEALSNDPVFTGTWNSGRNFTNGVRRSGHAVYVGLSAKKRWAMEMLRARVAGQGKVRRRG